MATPGRILARRQALPPLARIGGSSPSVCTGTPPHIHLHQRRKNLRSLTQILQVVHDRPATIRPKKEETNPKRKIVPLPLVGSCTKKGAIVAFAAAHFRQLVGFPDATPCLSFCARMSRSWCAVKTRIGTPSLQTFVASAGRQSTQLFFVKLKIRVFEQSGKQGFSKYYLNRDQRNP